MSTRAAIGVWTNRKARQWRGTYHHWDGYPSGLGAALWDLYHTRYENRLEHMLYFLIDCHPEGWSTFVHANWDLVPRWVDSDMFREFYEAGQLPPPCCYKGRGEEAWPLDQTSDSWLEWAYIFDRGDLTMTILKEVGKRVGDQWKVRWYKKATLPLTGSAPDWTIFE